MELDHQSKALRLGAWAIALALILRLADLGCFRPVLRWFSQPNTQSFLIYLETGRNVRFSASYDSPANSLGESAVPVLSEPEPVLPVYSRQDSTQILYACSLRPDTQALLEQPLTWDLTGPEPKVLILHTHATESYTRQGEDYEESSAFRTLDTQYNLVSVGEQVAQILQNAGITVIHDRTLHDYPSYNGSYNHARKSIQQILKENPEICLVLDLHRDASGDLKNQFRPVVSSDRGDVAQIMLVMGTNAGGQAHPHWQENLSLGLKIQAQLERQLPGITRSTSLRSQRFNQDLTPGSLLIEMGAAGNTHAEALRAAEELARAIIALSRGTGQHPGE